MKQPFIQETPLRLPAVNRLTTAATADGSFSVQPSATRMSCRVPPLSREEQEIGIEH